MFQKLTICLTCLFLFVANVSAQQTLVLTQKKFVDPGDKNFSTHTMLVPKGWSAEGGVWFANPQQFFKIPPSQLIKVVSPEGVGIEVGPTLLASDFRPSQQSLQYGVRRPQEMQSDGGMVVLYCPNSLQEWQRHYEEKVIAHESDKSIKNARVLEVFEIGELSQALNQLMKPVFDMVEQGNAMNRSMGFEQSCGCIALGFHVEYMKDGVQYERLHVIASNYNATDSELGRQIYWGTMVNTTYFAPKGRLETEIGNLVTISNSLRMTPEWSKILLKSQQDDRRAHMKAAKRIHEINMQTNRSIRESQNASWQRQQASNDRSHQRYINSIREVDVYSQSGQQYELPSSYNHVYGDGTGNFIMTNNALYDPNSDLNVTGSWSNLQPNR